MATEYKSLIQVLQYKWLQPVSPNGSLTKLKQIWHCIVAVVAVSASQGWSKNKFYFGSTKVRTQSEGRKRLCKIFSGFPLQLFTITTKPYSLKLWQYVLHAYGCILLELLFHVNTYTLI